MTPLITLVLASFLARFGYQMARSPVLPRFAQDLGAAPEMLGLIVAASTITGVVIKLPAGALSDVLGEAAGPILAGFLIASLSYAPAFTLIAALMVVVALIFAVFVRDPLTASGQA
jgi:MFS family permease